MSKAQDVISPADRIRELSMINDDVSVMLVSAGHAISSLASGPLPSSKDDNDSISDSAPTSGDRRKAFNEHTKSYFITLQAICARLNRQAYALEEAGIVTADAPILSLANTKKGGSQQGPGASIGSEGDKVKNGGLGNLDVGWLNSRGNKVGEEKEGELMSDAKALLERLVQQKKDGTGEDTDAEMKEDEN